MSGSGFAHQVTRAARSAWACIAMQNRRRTHQRSGLISHRFAEQFCAGLKEKSFGCPSRLIGLAEFEHGDKGCGTCRMLTRESSLMHTNAPGLAAMQVIF